MTTEIRRISSKDTIPLRLEVLRPGRPRESASFPGDDALTTVHLGALRQGQLLGIASLYEAEMPERSGGRALQLRGMATAPAARGTGLGQALLLACIELAREKPVELLWCNARTTAAGFYLKLGFEIVGDQFEIPDVGPHFRMALKIRMTNDERNHKS